MYSRFQWTKVAEDRNALTRLYEPLQPYILIELAKEAVVDTFIDVGANIGVYSIFMASLDSVTAVHAFEPAPKTYEELVSNIKLNDNGKVKTYKKALSDKSDTLTFGIINDYSGANCVVDSSLHDKSLFKREETVESQPLDSLGIKSAGRLALKIDVEGHEESVLKGAEQLLTKNQAIIQIEHYGEDDTVLRMLGDYGYRKLFNVGPDQYFTNIDQFTCETIVKVFERMAKDLIAANFDTPTNERRPLHLKLFPGFKVELSGGLAGFARRTKNRVLARR